MLTVLCEQSSKSLYTQLLEMNTRLICVLIFREFSLKSNLIYYCSAEVVPVAYFVHGLWWPVFLVALITESIEAFTNGVIRYGR